jgi:hypothetical protein
MSGRDGTLPPGWAVRVTTEQLIGGQPMVMIFAAAFSSPLEAVEAVKQQHKATPDEKVEALTVLRGDTLTALGIAPGQVVVL